MLKVNAPCLSTLAAWSCSFLFLLTPCEALPVASEEETEPAGATPTAAPTELSDDARLNGATEPERAEAFLKYSASTRSSAPLYPKAAMCKYVARLILKTDTDYALRQIDQAVTTVKDKAQAALSKNQQDTHALDPFDKHALVHTWILCRDQIPAATTEKIRGYVALWHHRVWKGYGAMNYRLMEDGSGFISAEQWPDLVDADGLSATQIKAITRERLFGYFTDIVHHNFGEYEAPTYEGIDLAAIKMLADNAEDPEMKKRASMTLDWMLLNLACSWNQGYNTASCGRAKYWVSTDTSPDELDSTAAIGWLYFGGNRPVRGRGMDDALSIWMACPGTYQPPEIVVQIARDRSAPVTHHGTVLLGHNQVRLTVFHSLSYSLASQSEFLSSPNDGLYKETRRQMLKWISDKPSSTFCPLQENPRRPYLLKEHAANAWGYGENPFEQTLQDDTTLIGIYAVPLDYPYYKLYAPFSQSGSIVKRTEKEGWVFCHTGSMLFAFRPVKSYTWAMPVQGHDVLWSDERKNGWILETSEITPYAGGGVDAELDRFATAVLTKTKIDATEIDTTNPRLRYTSLAGHDLDLTYRPHGQPYSNQQQINGQPIDYASYPLLGNPWVHQAVNGDLLNLHHGGLSLNYNFKTWTTQTE
jgi:hypothetical protein